VSAAFGVPAPAKEYKIPEVGNNERSQYYVLHDDGSFKYGYDTGDNHFESLKTNVDNEGMGRFGYKNSDGEDVHIEYTSGRGGFVARGSHIPQVHPDVTAAFREAEKAEPFVDPLADSEGDRSYNFQFDGEEHSRNEVSNSDGTVTGSYSYTDEFGNVKKYTYRAGKGIGFQIEGDDIPQQVHPVTSSSQTKHVGTSHAARGHTGSSKFHTSTAQQHDSQKNRQSNTYYQQSFTTSSTGNKNTQFGSKVKSQTAPARKVSTVKKTSHAVSYSKPVVKTSVDSQKYEAANTVASFDPSGRYSFGYDTSSHSRTEEGDENTEVEGSFTFVADDDNIERTVTYEASKDTGFIARGSHLPIGPVVPGASTGQVTGDIEKVETSEFVDPLAEDLDASYNFNFESDGYSRTETADEDGNVSGTYSILGEDNILRTYRFRAGKGIGFETEEISSVPSTRTTSVSASNKASTKSSYSGASQASIRAGVSSTTRTHGASLVGTRQSHASNQFTGSSSHSSNVLHHSGAKKEFVDPLAEDLDASYNFQFESEGYSRTESADEDGNVSGTYSILGEDNILRTYKFRAGKGIGFETEEISAVPSSSSSASTRASTHSVKNTAQTASASRGTTHTSSKRTNLHSGSSHRGSTTYSASTAHGTSGAGNRSHNVKKFTSSRSEANEIFPGFTLHQYHPSEGRGKYGYVLKFDN